MVWAKYSFFLDFNPLGLCWYRIPRTRRLVRDLQADHGILEYMTAVLSSTSVILRGARSVGAAAAQQHR